MSKITKQQVLDAEFVKLHYVFDCAVIDYFRAQPVPGLCNFPAARELIVGCKEIPDLKFIFGEKSPVITAQIFGSEESEQPITDDETLTEIVKAVFEKVK